MILRFPGLNFPARQYPVFTIFTTSRCLVLSKNSRLRVRDFDLCCPFRPAASTYFYSLDKEISRCIISNVFIMLSLSRRAVKPVLKGGIEDVSLFLRLSVLTVFFFYSRHG